MAADEADRLTYDVTLTAVVRLRDRRLEPHPHQHSPNATPVGLLIAPLRRPGRAPPGRGSLTRGPLRLLLAPRGL